MLFVPNAELVDDTTETIGFVYSYRPTMGQENWSRFRGWNFTCGCRSLEGRIFFADKNSKIWIYGTEHDPIEADYLDYISTVVDDVGVGIEFDWELPWLDMGQRSKTKQTKFISFDTRGASEFTVRMYVDNHLEVASVDAPQLLTEFSGGEQGLFGSGLQPYGGGRNTAVKKHIAWPAKFEIMKLRFSGIADAGLAFTSITIQYLQGGINR